MEAGNEQKRESPDLHSEDVALGRIPKLSQDPLTDFTRQPECSNIG